MNNQAQLKGRLGLSGTLVYHDKDGNEIGRAHLSGSIPLESDEQVEQAKELIHTEGVPNGDRSE